MSDPVTVPAPAVVPISGPDRSRRTALAAGQIGSNELNFATDTKRLYIGGIYIGALYHGAVANEAAMLSLDIVTAASPRGVCMGDTCLRIDTGTRWTCIGDRGATLADWAEDSTAAAIRALQDSTAADYRELQEINSQVNAPARLAALELLPARVSAVEQAKHTHTNATTLAALSTEAGILNFNGSPVGVGGGLTIIADADVPAGVTVQRAWVEDGDANGVFYAIGAAGGTWANPAGGAIQTLCTTGESPTVLTNRQAGDNWYIGQGIGYFVAFDLGPARLVSVNSYSLRNRGNNAYTNSSLLRTWKIQGSNSVAAWTVAAINGATWVDVDTRVNDTSMAGVADAWAHFTCAQSANYRYLRLVLTGNDSSGGQYLVVGEVEFYGSLTTPHTRPTASAGWLTDGQGHYVPYY